MRKNLFVLCVCALLWLSCRASLCGNGFIEPGETCDDGNTTSGDGCHQLCLEEVRHTFLMSSFTLPQDETDLETFSQDLNEDGVIDIEDNGLPVFANAFDFFFNLDTQEALTLSVESGSVLLGQDVITARFTNDDEVLFVPFLAELLSLEPPRFDGSDVVFSLSDLSLVEGSIEAGTLNAEAMEAVFPLVLEEDTPIFLPLSGVSLSGELTQSGIEQGRITGTINALDFARMMRPLADMVNERFFEAARFFGGGTSPIFCANQADCPATAVCSDKSGDLLATGFCLPPQEAAISLLFDQDRDGHIEVFFNEPSLSFFQNELSLLFDLVDFTPTGTFGSLFQLDTNDDGLRDAMGIGFGFSAVEAMRLP